MSSFGKVINLIEDDDDDDLLYQTPVDSEYCCMQIAWF